MKDNFKNSKKTKLFQIIPCLLISSIVSISSNFNNKLSFDFVNDEKNVSACSSTVFFFKKYKKEVLVFFFFYIEIIFILLAILNILQQFCRLHLVV
jgi:hypothetical protein